MASEIELRDKIILASNYKTDQEDPEFGDMAYRAFIRVMIYRREIAKQLLQEINEDNQKALRETFSLCNEQIKQLLGI